MIKKESVFETPFEGTKFTICLGNSDCIKDINIISLVYERHFSTAIDKVVRVNHTNKMTQNPEDL